jgi:hypothetical protein
VIQPTPCEKSLVGQVVDEARARELGFGSAIDLSNRTFTLPLEWEARQNTNQAAQWRPAEGYESPTSVTIEIRPTRFVHFVPQMAGCTDRLSVAGEVSFATADGALELSGQLGGWVNRDATRVGLSGRLDLSAGRGSLLLFPPSWVAAPRVGYVALGVMLTAEHARGSFDVKLIQAGTDRGDTFLGFSPLGGRFPIDACDRDQLPRPVNEPLAALTGKSLLELRDELATRLTPALATWSSGGQTTVTTELGAPSDACERPDGLEYELPLRLTSSDRRVDIATLAQGNVRFGEDGTASFFIGASGFSAAPDFTASTGISGVQLIGFDYGGWSAEIHLPAADSAAQGSLSVTGSKPETFVTVEQLDWRNE